jgi:hypothetical protein
MRSPFNQSTLLPLRPGGERELVTDANKEEYLRLFAQHRLAGQLEVQIKAFRSGLQKMIPPHMFEQIGGVFSASELQLLISGANTIDADDWRAHTRYSGGLTGSEPHITWFWDVVSRFSQEHKCLVIAFCTGSPCVPAGGFSEMMGMDGRPCPFTIEDNPVNQAALPTAATCFNTLKLPAYSSAAVLSTKLMLAIEGSTGFDENAIVH